MEVDSFVAPKTKLSIVKGAQVIYTHPHAHRLSLSHAIKCV